MIIETCAKVNLTLEMRFRRPDGFTELASVFQAIDLFDEIHFEPATELSLQVHGADLPADPTNLCWRAASRLADRLGRTPDVAMTLVKRIPFGAGLGGGSGNAAGVLGALHTAWGGGLTAGELAGLAAELGSDVPFFLSGGAAEVGGRGEQVQPVPSLPEPWRLVIMAPLESVWTAAVYRALQSFRAEAGGATEALARLLRDGEAQDWPRWAVNDLEGPATQVGATLADDRTRLATLALPGYHLCGSGGAWFVPVAASQADAVADQLASEWPGRPVWITRPVDFGWRWQAPPEGESW